MRRINLFVEDRDPPLGGIEYTEDLVNAMDLEHLERAGDSLSKLLKELRHKFQEWQRAEQSPETGNPSP
jgi:hypothetical protein